LLYHAPKHVFFVSTLFLMRKSITKRSCRVLYTTLPMPVHYKNT